MSSRCPCIEVHIRLVSNFIGQKIWSYWTVVDVQLRRTLMTTPVTAQGPGIQGMSTPQQGYAPGFPPPLGIEQYLGQPQNSGQPQQYGFTQPQCPGQSQFPGQQQLFGQQLPIQQIVQSVVSQLLPLAHQVIVPQVLAIAMQQIPLHLQQLVAQQLRWELTQQAGWQQPQFGPAGQTPFGRPYPRSF